MQLPLYRAMVEASGRFAAERARSASAFYCILAEHDEDTVFDEEHAYREGGQAEAEERIVELLTSLARGVFYPPSKNSMWQRAYGGLIWESPEEGIDRAWLADQAARREGAA